MGPSTQPAQWDLNLRPTLPRCLLQGSGWIGEGESLVFTGTCAYPQPPGGSGQGCPARLDMFAFSCSGRGPLIEALPGTA